MAEFGTASLAMQTAGLAVRWLIAPAEQPAPVGGSDVF